MRIICIKDNPTVELWREKHLPDVQKITRQLIDIARKNMPGAHEFIYHDAVGYSINDSPFDRICYIAPQEKGYVNFGFFFGVGLPDPKKLLVGEGKRLRHVKIRDMEGAQDPALAKLIVATWKKAPESVAIIHTGLRKSKA